MPSFLKVKKVQDTLPASLTPNTMYFVKKQDYVEIYISDLAGQVAYKASGDPTNLSSSIAVFFQIGVVNGPHYHAVGITSQQAYQLISSELTEVVVRSQTVENHSHDITVRFNAVTHRFYVSDISNNDTDNHTAWVFQEPTNGTNGLSAYELAVSNGFLGTVSDWLVSLKGTSGNPLINVKTLTQSYTLHQDDSTSTLLRFDSVEDVTLTIPVDSTLPGSVSNFPSGASVLISRNGIGQVTLVKGSGVTVDSPDGYGIAKQFGKIVAVKTGPNHWEIEGNLTEVVI